jgi:large subunit ribosomal protein L25
MTAAPTSARSPKNDSTTMPGLVAAPRTAHGKGGSRQLRKTGQIPAIAYGKGFDATSIAVSPKEILSILKTEKGQNNVIQMKLDGAKPTDILVMIKDYSYHPVSRELEHVDFVQVKLDQEVMVDLPLLFTGKPVGLAEGGIIRQVYRTIPIRCLPNLIPVKVEIDIAHLALGEHIATKDLKLPAGVTVRLPEAQTLIAIVTPDKDRTAEEAAAGAPGAPGAPAAAGAAAAPAAAGAKDAKGGAAPAADAKAAPAKDAKKK